MAIPAETIVLQSYRTERVEPIVRVAMTTVRQWAQMRGYSYEFMDDSFFDAVPMEFRKRTKGAIWQMADLARLLHLKRLLESHGRAIWIDADVAILDAARFQPPENVPFFFFQEYWLRDLGPGPAPDLQIEQRVNNSICGFARGSRFLDWYTAMTERQTFEAPADTDWNLLALSTRILSDESQRTDMPLYTHAGIMSAGLQKGLSMPAFAPNVWQVYAAKAQGIAAINMTLSMVRRGTVTADDLLEALGRLWMLNSSSPGW